MYEIYEGEYESSRRSAVYLKYPTRTSDCIAATPFCQFDFKSIRIKSNDKVFWFNKGFVIENNYFPLLQLTVMIFVFLGLVAGFGGLLAIVFHFFSSLGFPLVLDFFLSSWGKRAVGKWSSGCGELGARRQNSCSGRRGLVLIRRSPPLLTPPRRPGT